MRKESSDEIDVIADLVYQAFDGTNLVMTGKNPSPMKTTSFNVIKLDKTNWQLNAVFNFNSN